MSRSTAALVPAAAFLLTAGSAAAIDFTWTGGDVTIGNFPLDWSPAGVPSVDDTLIFSDDRVSLDANREHELVRLRDDAVLDLTRSVAGSW